MRTLALSIAILAGLTAGCSKQTTADTSAPAAAESQAPAAAAAMAPAGPPAAGAQSFSGTVLETMDAASYTYVRVKTDAGDVWAASGQFKVAVGDKVTVPIETPMENFHSTSLNRDFPVIYFASRIAREGDPAPAAMPAPGAMPALAPAHASNAGPAAGAGPMGGAMGGMMGSRQAAPVVQKMPPPEGGLSVADVWAKRASLAGKTVTVRGTVVKFNGAIMGRNWIHIQDGSGKADDGTHDLTITTDAAAKVGDVVTVTGVIAVDKDFTAGYAYAVIMEGAKLK
jgi:hypothetical protein